jgi:hypothetical protein
VSPSTSPPSPLGGAPDRPGRLGLKEGPEVKDERRRREDYDEIDRSIEKTEGSSGTVIFVGRTSRVARRHQGRRAYRDFGQSVFEEK